MIEILKGASAVVKQQRLKECMRKSGGKMGCHHTKIGYVTVNAGPNRVACIHTPNGGGICWPGGKTGYNSSIQP